MRCGRRLRYTQSALGAPKRSVKIIIVFEILVVATHICNVHMYWPFILHGKLFRVTTVTSLVGFYVTCYHTDYFFRCCLVVAKCFLFCSFRRSLHPNLVRVKVRWTHHRSHQNSHHFRRQSQALRVYGRKRKRVRIGECNLFKTLCPWRTL